MKEPSPLTTVVILLACIIILGVVFAAIKVFLFPEGLHQCVAGDYPDPVCTPGAIFDATAAQICVSGYSSKVRDVSLDTKKQVFAQYNIPYDQHSNYEVDHLISLELGGSNDISNLWPEAYNSTLGARVKDKVENYLHKEVCSGRMNLSDAQRIIAGNWSVALEWS